MENPIITCKNCGNTFKGKYCNQCGEKVYSEEDKSVWHIFEELFHFVSHFEGTLFTTIKTMTRYPGKLSLDYCNGIRKKYFKPISFFLLIVILYLLFPMARGLNFSIENHLNSWYRDYGLNTIRNYMIKTHLSEAIIVTQFDVLAEKVSKLLLFILIPVMAFFSALFTRRAKRHFFDHLIFATETISLFILWGFLLLPLIVRIIGKITTLPQNTDPYVLPFLVAVPLTYVFVASRRFFNFKSGKAFLYSALFLFILMAFIHYVYAFILFFITANLLH
jgi:hypothetical protein